MDKRFIKEMVSMYDNLIKIAEKKQNVKVKMDWGCWTPTKRCLDSIKRRRNKLYYGRLISKLRKLNILQDLNN